MNGSECFSWLDINNSTTIYDINAQFTERHLGGIVFTGILMFLGLFGNLTVLWIYIRRFKMSNYRTYTIWLALMDVGNCFIGMPFIGILYEPLFDISVFSFMQIRSFCECFYHKLFRVHFSCNSV